MRISAFVLAASMLLATAGAAFAEGGCSSWVHASKANGQSTVAQGQPQPTEAHPKS